MYDCSLFLHDHALEPHLRGWREAVAGCQVTRNVETARTRRAGVGARAAGDAEGDAVGVRGGADGWIGNEYEGISFDKDRISRSRVSIRRFQIEDLIRRGVGAG